MKKNLARQLGIWSSLFISVLGAIYLGMLIIFFSTEGFVFPPGPTVQLIGGIVTFLTAPGLIVLFTAIHYEKDRENKILSSLGISFITLFAATVSINRFVQLTVIHQSAAGAQDLARFLPYATGSVMFALEMLGWGFFSSLAAISVAPLFSGSRLTTSIRWSFVGYALFSFMGVIGYMTQNSHYRCRVYCLGSDPSSTGYYTGGIFHKRKVALGLAEPFVQSREASLMIAGGITHRPA